MTNEELLAKAKLTTDEIAASGKMNPKQADKFISYLYDMTFLRNVVRLVRFTQESMQLDKISVHSRAMLLKTEARGLAARRGISTSQVSLQPVAVTVPWEISDEFADFNIEEDSIYDTIAKMMATQFANDWEELLITGNTVGYARLHSDMYEGGDSTKVVKDSTMAAFDGWMRLADSGNVYDAGGADISSSLLSAMIRTMPRKYRRVRKNMRFLCSMDHEQLYRERKGSRQTAAGDAAESSQQRMTPYGIELVPVPLLDSDPRCVEHVTFAAAPSTQALTYKPVRDPIYVTDTDLANSPATPYTEGAAADYTVDKTLGQITTVVGGGLNAGGAKKVTYHSEGQMLLTDYQNLIMAIGKDISVESDRDAGALVNQYFIHARVYGQVEEATAIVKGINIGLE